MSELKKELKEEIYKNAIAILKKSTEILTQEELGNRLADVAAIEGAATAMKEVLAVFSLEYNMDGDR